LDGRPLTRFLALTLLVWTLAWLPLGLFKGDPDYVLTAVSRHSLERQVYQALLYCGLLLVFIDSWKRHAPRLPGPGRARDFLRYAGLGLGSALVLRGLMVVLGGRPLPDVAPPFQLADILVALLSAVAVAAVEEAVFRGFLLGRLAQISTPSRAVVISSALFASVHLFRPGPAGFKAGYALGLFLLAVLLARIAWVRCSVAASAGFHAGVIWPNLVDPWPDLAQTWWSGWQQEPASGALSWLLTLALWGQWEWWQSGRERDQAEELLP
jgi:membrane protease YdiL (CAAX protease family)